MAKFIGIVGIFMCGYWSRCCFEWDGQRWSDLLKKWAGRA